MSYFYFLITTAYPELRFDHYRETVEILSCRCETAINLLDSDKLGGGGTSMRHATIDFTVSPVTYSPQMALKYWWNHPRHEAVSYPKPLTREIVQGQAILNDIASLPQHLRYRYQKRYQSLISEKGLHEAHHFLYFTFHQKIWPRLPAVNQRYEMLVENWPVTLTDTPDILDFNLLPDMNNTRIKQLASNLSAFFFNFSRVSHRQINKLFLSSIQHNI